MKHKTPIANKVRSALETHHTEELADVLEDIEKLEIAYDELEDDVIILRRRNAVLRKMVNEK